MVSLRIAYLHVHIHHDIIMLLLLLD